MPRHRRCSRLRRIVGGVSVGALLLLAGGGGHNAYSRRPVFSLPFPLVADSPAPPPFPFAADFSPSLSPSPSPQSQYSRFRLSDDSLARRLRAGHSPPLQDADVDAVLLPDQEVLVLDDAEPTGDAMCAFQGGASSPARPLGRLPASGFHAYVCRLPEPAQSFQQLQAPLLLHSSTSSAAAAAPDSPSPGRALFNWSSDPIVFDSALLDGGDVLVFAKGISRRQGLQCLYCYSDGADTMLASTPAITSVQQVTRCPSPPTPIKSGGSTKVLVTLGVTGEDPMPSLATFRRRQAESSSVTPQKTSICACTMGRNISKFLREWALYHSSIGVDHFFIYDNGSEDNLAGLVAQLISAGLNITTVPWPWTRPRKLVCLIARPHSKVHANGWLSWMWMSSSSQLAGQD